MAKEYQAEHKNLNQFIFHEGLIYILVKHHLAKIGDVWDAFILSNGYKKPLIFKKPDLSPRVSRNPPPSSPTPFDSHDVDDDDLDESFHVE